ncbi:unnamed protein product [Phaeothamnion confervicola]
MDRQPGAELDEAWGILSSLFFARRDLFFAAMADVGLTPPHGQALMLLVHGPARMRDMASQLRCDASYVTAVVDRFEELGLAERRASTTDRRVREVALTTRGRLVADGLMRTMSAAPEALRRLSPADCKALVRVLRKLDVPATAPLPRRGA